MLAENISEQAHTKWAALIVFVPKKHGTIMFCVNHQKHNAATKRNTYHVPPLNKRFDSLTKPLCSSHWMQTVKNGKSSLWITIKMKQLLPRTKDYISLLEWPTGAAMRQDRSNKPRTLSFLMPHDKPPSSTLAILRYSSKHYSNISNAFEKF